MSYFKLTEKQINRLFRVLIIIYSAAANIAFISLLVYTSSGNSLFNSITGFLLSLINYSFPIVGFAYTLIALQTYNNIGNKKMIVILTILNILFALSLADLLLRIIVGKDFVETGKELFHF